METIRFILIRNFLFTRRTRCFSFKIYRKFRNCKRSITLQLSASLSLSLSIKFAIRPSSLIFEKKYSSETGKIPRELREERID